MLVKQARKRGRSSFLDHNYLIHKAGKGVRNVSGTVSHIYFFSMISSPYTGPPGSIFVEKLSFSRSASGWRRVRGNTACGVFWPGRTLGSPSRRHDAA